MKRDADAIVRTLDVLCEQIGAEEVVEVSGVIPMFNVVDRVADSTGISIDEGMTHDLRHQVGGELGMKHLASEERAAR